MTSAENRLRRLEQQAANSIPRDPFWSALKRTNISRDAQVTARVTPISTGHAAIPLAPTDTVSAQIGATATPSTTERRSTR